MGLDALANQWEQQGITVNRHNPGVSQLTVMPDSAFAPLGSNTFGPAGPVSPISRQGSQGSQSQMPQVGSMGSGSMGYRQPGPPYGPSQQSAQKPINLDPQPTNLNLQRRATLSPRGGGSVLLGGSGLSGMGGSTASRYRGMPRVQATHRTRGERTPIVDPADSIRRDGVANGGGSEGGGAIPDNGDFIDPGEFIGNNSDPYGLVRPGTPSDPYAVKGPETFTFPSISFPSFGYPSNPFLPDSDSPYGISIRP